MSRARRTPALRPARAAVLAGGLGLMLALGACGTDPGPRAAHGGPAAKPPASTKAAASGRKIPDKSGTPTSTPPAATVPPAPASEQAVVSLDPAHAMPAPGVLKKRLYGSDILVYSPETLDPSTIEAIDAVEGVRTVETMAMAQVPIQGKAINVVAVDPGTYRRYTPPGSGQLTDIWDRVAGGELAVRPDLKGRLGDSADGFVRLGNNTEAPDLHIGAYAPQIPQVDAVVNTSYIDSLGMKPDNALVIWTGSTSPQEVRTNVEKLAGSGASVQLLGPDLDISVQQTAFLAGSVADAVGTFNYSVLGGGRIAADPAWVGSHIITAPVPILGSVTCNKAMLPQLTAALTEVVERGLADKIHPGEYAGCYTPRFIAGTTSLSNHAFGLALDFNTPGNQRGTVGEMDRSVVQIFEKWGFTWGGRWGYTDPMHFEMNAIITPR